jgi:hypothetical protein
LSAKQCCCPFATAANLFAHPAKEFSESAIIGLRIVANMPEERVMQNPVRRSEHYRERAAKYHELAKRAHPHDADGLGPHG